MDYALFICTREKRGKLTRDKSQYQRLPFLSQTKKREKKKKKGERGETALENLIGANSILKKFHFE